MPANQATHFEIHMNANEVHRQALRLFRQIEDAIDAVFNVSAPAHIHLHGADAERVVATASVFAHAWPVIHSTHATSATVAQLIADRMVVISYGAEPILCAQNILVE